MRRAAPTWGVTRVTHALRPWFTTPLNTAVTLAVVTLSLVVLVPFTRWAVVDAVWSGTAADCQADSAGACWTFVTHKLRFILFGLYPPDEQWRPTVATALLVALIAASALPALWKRALLIAWLIGLLTAFWIMRGGGGGLAPVPTRLWGGLPITLMLTSLGLAGGFPLAVLLALGRRSRLPLPRIISTAIVEMVRGIPLIAVLYVAVLVVPLTLPAGMELDKLLLAQLGIAIFAAAYLAEAVRAGLQVIPKGQREAALALGLGWWQSMRLIILPQALRVVIPSLVSIAVGFFQNTSLVVIVGVFDLLNTSRFAAQDPAWLGFHSEAYAFAALLFFTGSAAISRYGLWLELRMSPYRPLPTTRARPHGVLADIVSAPAGAAELSR